MRERDAFLGGSTSTAGSSTTGATDLRERDAFLGGSISSAGSSTTGATDLRERDAFLGGSIPSTGSSTTLAASFLPRAVLGPGLSTSSLSSGGATTLEVALDFALALAGSGCASGAAPWASSSRNPLMRSTVFMLALSPRSLARATSSARDMDSYSTSAEPLLPLDAAAFLARALALGASTSTSSSSESHPMRQSLSWRGVMKCIEACPMVTCGDLGAMLFLLLLLLPLGASSSSATGSAAIDLRLRPDFFTFSSTSTGTTDLRPRRGGGAAASTASTSSLTSAGVSCWTGSVSAFAISGITDLRPRRAGLAISTTAAAVSSSATGATGSGTSTDGDLTLGEKDFLGERALGAGDWADAPDIRRPTETTDDTTEDTMLVRLQRDRFGVLGATSA